MNIVVKFPTRSRPEKFLSTLKGYINNSVEPNKVHYLITIDADDPTMHSDDFRVKLLQAIGNNPHVSIIDGISKNKINAVNRDLEKLNDSWDILVLASDDMICVQNGWDGILISEMKYGFPDTDGVLWHNDGYLGQRLNTMCILGKSYFNRFKYIYNPEYTSLWCDNEFMEVAEMLGKQKYFDQVLFKHEHPAHNASIVSDDQYKTTESYYYSDKEIYERRKVDNFYISNSDTSVPVAAFNPVAETATKPIETISEPEIQTNTLPVVEQLTTAGFIDMDDLEPGIVPFDASSMSSQNNEEEIIVNYFGADFKGSCLDIGANDGKTLSNTYGCIRRGWSAVMVEPSNKAFAMMDSNLKGYQKVKMFKVAITDKSGKMDFFESGSHLGNGDHSLLSTLKESETARWGNTAQFTKTEVDAITFSQLLFISNVSEFDLISIDAEGVDFEILTQMNLSAIKCRMLIIETNGVDDQKYIDYIAQFGMHVIHKNPENLIFAQ